jgi:hypothetical protein
MTGEPQQSRNRYFGKVALAFQGALMVKLLDGRRCTVPAREVTESGLSWRPGERIEISLFTRADGTLHAFDPARVD